MSVYASFHSEFDSCWNCEWPDTQYSELWRRGLQAHHLRGGSGRRKKDRRQLLMLCGICHDLCEPGDIIRVNGKRLPELTEAGQMWLKMTFDPEHYDPDWLRALPGCGDLPEPIEPERPQF